jgi:hypothetical protein
MSYNRELKRSSIPLLINARVLHYTHDMGSVVFKIIFVYLCKGLYMNVIFLHIHIISCIFIIEIVHVGLDCFFSFSFFFFFLNLYIRGCLEYVANACDS